MSIAKLPVRHTCFVYMLLCRDDGPIYVKVGISSEPRKRLANLKTGAAVTPRQLAVCGLQSSTRARIIEKALHLALGRWATTGEWFKLDISDRAAFNAAWRTVFEAHSTRSLPLRWKQSSVKGLRPANAPTKRAYMRRLLFGHPDDRKIYASVLVE